jgi:hypothetical protein
MARCSTCGAKLDVSGGEVPCPDCGAVRSASRGGLASDRASSVQDRVATRGDALGRRLAGVSARLGGAEAHENAPTRSAPGPRVGGAPAGAAPRLAASPPRLPPGFLPTAADVEELRRLVFASDHVTSNARYDSAARSTRFRYLEDDPEFNAYATTRFVGPEVVVFGGLVRRFAEVALCTTVGGGADSERALLGYVSARTPEDRGAALALEQRGGGSLLPWQRELLSTMVMFVIAHELGHVCYGHVFGPGYSGQPLDVCRNQERDADRFAGSLIAASPFAPSWLFGQLMALVAIAMMEGGGVITEFGTHPTARERLENSVRNNREAAAALGLTDAVIGALLPAPG